VLRRGSDGGAPKARGSRGLNVGKGFSSLWGEVWGGSCAPPKKIFGLLSGKWRLYFELLQWVQVQSGRQTHDDS